LIVGDCVRIYPLLSCSAFSRPRFRLLSAQAKRGCVAPPLFSRWGLFFKLVTVQYDLGIFFSAFFSFSRGISIFLLLECFLLVPFLPGFSGTPGIIDCVYDSVSPVRESRQTSSWLGTLFPRNLYFLSILIELADAFSLFRIPSCFFVVFLDVVLGPAPSQFIFSSFFLSFEFSCIPFFPRGV